MCYNPVKIYNRKRLFRTGVDSAVVTVPCGKCAECKEQKQNDYVFRTWYEIQKMKRSHVCSHTFFLTFTFNKENVPVIHTERFFPIDHRYKGKGITYSKDVAALNSNRLAIGSKVQFVPTDTDSVLMVPDFRMVQKFFKKLRSRLDRDCPHMDFDISYLCATELGSLHFRPHYHLILVVGCNQNFSDYTFSTYVRDAWTISEKRRNFESGKFESFDVPIGRITNDRIFTDGKFAGQQRTDFQAVKYVCKYCTKEIGLSAGDKERSSRLRLSIRFGMPEKGKPDFISDVEYKQGFKFLPFGKNGENKKYLIPIQYYQRKKLSIHDYVEKEKNARYVEDVEELSDALKESARKYLFSSDNPFSRYNLDCTFTTLDVDDYIDHLKFDSSFLAECKGQRLINKAESLSRDIGSAFLYSWQPHLLHAFEDMYGITFDDLKKFRSTVYSVDFLDYIYNIRPYVYWSFKTVRFNKFNGFDGHLENNKAFPYRFFAQHTTLWSDVFSHDQFYMMELLCTFYDYYKECIKSIREDLILMSDKAVKGYVQFLKTLKHNEEFQSSRDTAGGRYSRNVVESSQFWCHPYTGKYIRFKSSRASSGTRRCRMAT